MRVPHIVFAALALPVFASCVTSEAMRQQAAAFRVEIQQVEERTGEDLAPLKGFPAVLEDLAARQDALESGALGVGEAAGGGALALLLAGYAAYKKAKNDTHKERDMKRIARHERVDDGRATPSA